jgi:type VI secretion system protein ImpH
VAAPERKPDLALIRLMTEQGPRFGFFQAVQLLHRLWPDAVPVGELGPPSKEPVRFRHDPALVFSASDVKSIRIDEQHPAGPPAELVATFLGLTGAASPLALGMCEDVIRDRLDDSGALAAFYDVFHHRLLSLFYRTWKKYRFSVGYRADSSDVMTRRGLAFVGVDIAGAVPKSSLPPIMQLALAPLLSQRTRSARTLQIVLERLVPQDVEVRIESFVERHVTIADDQRVALGRRNSTLNGDLTIGRRVRDRSGRFRVCVGPVDYLDFERMMPGGPLYPAIRCIIEQFSRGIAEAELEVTLREGESPRFALGSERGAILGRTTRLPARHQRPMRMRVLLRDESEHSAPQMVSDAEP